MICLETQASLLTIPGQNQSQLRSISDFIWPLLVLRLGFYDTESKNTLKTGTNQPCFVSLA